MRQIISIAKFTIKENIFNRVFNGFIMFGVVLILATSVLKDISLYEESRVIQDTGLFLIEFFVLLIAIFISSNQFLKDKKEKSIYIVLTKPVTRGMYIVGRLLGMILSILLNIAIMGGILFGIVIWQHGKIDINYIYMLTAIFYKLSIVASIGVFFSVISDSFITSNIFTFSVYILGHAVLELKMLGDKVSNPIYKWILDLLYYILPNFRVLNYRDYLTPEKFDFVNLTLYTFGYIFVITAMTNIIFQNRKI
ncbi:ABC transporter permease [Haliovirga abyssi]|uniref:Membrane protein n=1 Tax=Haliovirga abyssi TaxID=2996794 RepID=A0AAU9DBS5_9FUSO|nr:ABC transporter permease subunit [Haliovirga abyssi]BDU49568.1 membrane protein [Haliovirga abyssi]